MAKKSRKCRQCKKPFNPSNSLQVACSLPCAIAEGRVIVAKKQAAADKQWGLDNEKLTSVAGKLQRAFNAYIRTRDYYEPCAACGDDNPTVRDDWGGVWDAGHYMSVGSRPNLRFNEANCYKCCKTCNNSVSRPNGNREGFKRRLDARFGPWITEWLETNHTPLKLNKEQLRALTKYYKQQTKLLKRLHNNE